MNSPESCWYNAVELAVEQLAARFARPPLDGEIARARAEFDRQRGAVCDDEELYETHVGAFLEWYCLERPLKGGEPPVTLRLRELLGNRAREGEVSDESRILMALATAGHSVFEVLHTRLSQAGCTRLLDLPGGGVWRVQNGRIGTGILARGDIFEARLVPWEGEVRLGPVLVFHPRGARESIHRVLGELRAQGAQREMAQRLAAMRLQHDRCRNIPMDRIYALRTSGPSKGSK